MFDFLSDADAAIRNFSLAFIPAFLGIILHEVAHGWMARAQGDRTAESLGRLTLNPLPHIDPLGLLVFVLTSLGGSFVIGWARPVPINPRNFRRPRRGLMLVALAGPVTNILLALAFGLLFKLALTVFPPYLSQLSPAQLFILKCLQLGIVINLGLALFNLLPVPPLDGSKVISYFLPAELAWRYLSIERWGFLILILLLASNVLGRVISPLLRGGCQLILTVLGIS